MDRTFDRPDTDFRPREILQDRDVAAGGGGGRANAFADLRVSPGVPVREIQPERVGAGREELGDFFLIARRRTNRGQNTGAAHEVSRERTIT